MTAEPDPLVLPPGYGDVDTPGVQLSILDLSTAEMGSLDDASLEAIVTAMRHDAWTQYLLLARWVRVIRARRTLAQKSQRKAAKGTRVSRAAIQKAVKEAKAQN